MQQDSTVKDFAVKGEGNRIYVTIQTDASTNKDKVKSLIDSAVRQLAFHAGGKVPTKDYYGQLWDKNSGIITVFTGVKTEILTGTKSPGESSPIIYH